MDAALRLSGDRFPKHIATRILTLIERLPPGDGLCHGDLLPGNVILTAEGPRLIDWAGAMRAPAGLDLGCCHVLLSELVPEIVDDPERPRAINTALQSEYARLSGMSPAALTAAMEPYLPIVCVLVLLGGAFPAQRERLIQRVEVGLRSD
jgi:Ser/Thr protein kinase RdoA (MazF antagonist)